MTNSTQLAMPYLEAAQAQKHVTHNEALRVLDAVVMLAVLDRDLSAPSGSPADGDRYLVASGGTGAWSGRDGEIAAWQDGAWGFHAAREGWRLWVADEGVLLVFDGASWTGAATQNAALLGVNTTAIGSESKVDECGLLRSRFRKLVELECGDACYRIWNADMYRHVIMPSVPY